MKKLPGLLGKTMEGRSKEDWELLLARRKERLAVFRQHEGMEEVAADEQKLVDDAEAWLATFDAEGGRRWE